jgi:hypothetical protein
MFAKPAPGRTVRDPELLDILPEAGREVPDTAFWVRRLRDGDITSGAAPADKSNGNKK